MDVFYYWKNIDEDLKAGRIGWFRSNKEKLAELQDGAPDLLWVFKTPKGLKGQVQLVAQLVWADAPVAPFTRTPGESYIFYDPTHLKSARFTNSGSAENIEAVTDWVRRNFPGSVKGNFQGTNGQQPLRGAVLRELRDLTADWGKEPFVGAEIE
jgi:hypothetical protein